MLPSAYWLLSLFKTVSKYNTSPLPNWANNSLTSKGYKQNVHTRLHAALALISKQAKLLKTTAVWHRSVYGNGLFAYRPFAALIGYAAPVCVEYGLSRTQ
jgi:hypothetical protein